MARLGAPTVRDGGATFDVQDDRQILQTFLPLRTYNNNSGTDAYTEPDRGRSRPMLYGFKGGMRPVQVAIDYPYGGPRPMGVYEIVDTTDTPNGIYSPVDPGDMVAYWYLSDEAALGRREAERVKLDDVVYTSAFTWTLSPARLSILRDMRPLIITEENNKLQFDIGAAPPYLTAVITQGVYGISDDAVGGSVVGLVKAITDAMNTAAGTADIVCAFIDSTQKVRISKAAGTLRLRCATGAAAQSGIWALLGFDASTDKTAGSPYNADQVFTSNAYQQVVRLDCNGYRDDLSGTYTGTTNAVIQKAPDIAHHILRVFLKQPTSAINVASFVAARSTTWGAKPCSLYIGSPRTVADIFSELETTGNFDLVLSGGIWSCIPRDTSVPAGTPELVDADYLSFESYYNPEDLYGTVTLTYDESPDGGDPVVPRRDPWGGTAGRTKKGETIDATVALRHGRSEQKTFKTCLRDEANATNPLAGSRLEAIATQAQTKRRRFRFSTKGKALLTPVGGKLKLTRTKGLDTTGALSGLLVRVISKRDDWARWISDVEAIEVI